MATHAHLGFNGIHRRKCIQSLNKPLPHILANIPPGGCWGERERGYEEINHEEREGERICRNKSWGEDGESVEREDLLDLPRKEAVGERKQREGGSRGKEETEGRRKK